MGRDESSSSVEGYVVCFFAGVLVCLLFVWMVDCTTNKTEELYDQIRTCDKLESLGFDVKLDYSRLTEIDKVNQKNPSLQGLSTSSVQYIKCVPDMTNLTPAMRAAVMIIQGDIK